MSYQGPNENVQSGMNKFNLEVSELNLMDKSNLVVEKLNLVLLAWQSKC